MTFAKRPDCLSRALVCACLMRPAHRWDHSLHPGCNLRGGAFGDRTESLDDIVGRHLGLDDLRFLRGVHVSRSMQTTTSTMTGSATSLRPARGTGRGHVQIVKPSLPAIAQAVHAEFDPLARSSPGATALPPPPWRSASAASSRLRPQHLAGLMHEGLVNTQSRLTLSRWRSN